MDKMISLEKLTSFVVDINQDLFRKFEKGIKAHFTKYMTENYPSALSGDQVDLEALGIGVQALRANYLKKNSDDYGSEDSAAFLLSGYGLFTAEYLSVNAVKKMMESIFDSSQFIENVYVKRAVTTGRLIPCVSRKQVESFLSDKDVTDRVERQLEEMKTILENYDSKQIQSNGFEQYQVVSLIAEKTAEIIMRRMNHSQAV